MLKTGKMNSLYLNMDSKKMLLLLNTPCKHFFKIHVLYTHILFVVLMTSNIT